MCVCLHAVMYSYAFIHAQCARVHARMYVGYAFACMFMFLYVCRYARVYVCMHCMYDCMFVCILYVCI